MKIARLLVLALVLLGAGLAWMRSRSEKHFGGDNYKMSEAKLQGDVRGSGSGPDWTDPDDSRGPGPCIWDIAFHADGKHLLSATDFGVILWDLETGALVRTMEKSDPSSEMALSADGKWVFASHRRSPVGLWQVGTGKRVRVLKNNQNVVNVLAISDDGRLALVGGSDNDVQLWDTAKEEIIHRLFGHKYAVDSVALSSDSKLGVSSSFDQVTNQRTMNLWDLQKGKLIRTHEMTDRVARVCFSRDDRWVYSLGDALRAWDIETGVLIHLVKGPGKNRRPLAFSPDKRFCLTLERASEKPQDATLAVWDVLAGKTVMLIEREKDNRRIDRAEFAPNGKLAAIAGERQLLEVWNMETGKILLNLTSRDDRRFPVGPQKRGIFEDSPK